ncbi:TIR domain-containing protein [Cystobacter ferrugineus]|uniref:TIR domain-containing protein n=1 Tax=Cystobacter ferrugineus TaxID=83449 RepID=A0A1L9BDR1_9BACT|nr:TIR domain-containing protein [Cystobacter ferrugineus]OJH40373.1 hypothetical protein BON30_15210 [Cystobacter ferrugineus]
MDRPTVFISYSHEDEAWKERVSTHLTVLHESLEAWDDSHIEPGADWRTELEQAISGAGAAVLLISAHFLSSRFILEEEVPRLLQRRADSGLHLIPLLLSPCDWEAAEWLQRLQLRPRGARALSEQSRHAIDAELASLAKELRLLTSRSVQDVVSAPYLPRPVDVSISRLPLSGEHLFGRERELALLDGAWADPDTHVISLVAWGGVGKSSLVNQWLGKLAMNHYRGAHRVYGWSFFSQGQRDTTALADDFLSEALKRMGDPAPTQGAVWERGERLARYIQQERMLLILDGLEPLQAQPGPTWGRLKDPGLSVLVRELAFFNPGLCVITSRVRVTDIDHFRNTTAPVIELEGLSEAAGAELLQSLGVGGSQEELQQASRELGGHSLALNLLGTYLFGELCRVYTLLGEPARAVQYGERAVGLSRETGAAWQHSRQLAILACALTQCGRSAEAEELCLRAASLPRGEDWLVFLFGDLAYCELLLDQGRSQEVFLRLGPYVEWERSSGSRQLVGTLQWCLGKAHLRRSAEAPESLGLALEFLSEGILLMRKVGTPMLITPALTSRAAVHRLRGSFELAWRDLPAAPGACLSHLTQANTSMTTCPLADPPGGT